MQEFAFEATGTQWVIVVDQEIDHVVFEDIKKFAWEFEERFSRFKESSEIGKINAQCFGAVAGMESSREYEFVISDDLAEMLRFGKELERLSEGAFDLNVGTLLVGHGYDGEYSFQKDSKLLEQIRGDWEIDSSEEIANGAKLKIKGLVQLDLGAFGKGYLIDQIAALLINRGVKFFLIDGGRDFYGTSKADGSAWLMGLEHPFDATMAIGEFPLLNCALACSGISQRKVKDFHHFMDTKTGMPLAEPVGVFVQADNCMLADGVSTAMAVSHQQFWAKLVTQYQVKGAIVRMNGGLVDYGLEGFYR